MSQVDRAAVDLPTQAVDLHNRLREFQPALERHVGELALAGATPDEQLELGVMREHMQAVSELAQAAVAAITEADIPLRDAPEEILSSTPVRNRVRDYANQRGGGFTIRDLKDYLSDLGVELPKDNRAFQRQFANWQEEIVTERASAGEKRCWVKLNPRTYALAWLGTPPPVGAETASPADTPPTRRARRAARPTEPATTEPVAPRAMTADEVNELALKLVSEAPDDHGGLLVERLAAQSGGDISSAWLVLNRLVDAGKLVQENADNAVFFRSVAPTSTEQDLASGEDPLATAALRIVQEASGEPAKVLIGQLIKEMNLPAPGARHVFETLVKAGQIHRYSAEGRVRYGTEPREPQVRPAAASVVESRSTPTLPDTYTLLAAEEVLKVLSGRGVPFGKTFTPQEISRLIGGGGDPDLEDFSPDVVKSAASYLWSLGFVTRVEARGQLKLQLADRSIMTGMKSQQRRADILTLLTAGMKYVPPQQPARRPPAKKKR